MKLFEDVSELSPGDRVRQVEPFGLGIMEGVLYVVEVANGKLLLSREPEGTPLTDLHGRPRRYPRYLFEKIFSE